MGEINMQYLNNILAENELLSNDEISLETPIGWSSTCFNETIDYYTECNSINLNSDPTNELENIN
ncbi:conserved hypothetical plastid protein (plastid) [Chondrus crispus]|uniref:Conserved hypothetical plastid protein n=1 Tax=Chondrus crispus TaxID=2769 RepID=M5DET4_CHOCR|nr:conserved hypothetical plastid protein [Chondrus crispus]CCP38196.1 conserved hypothetical plastid protein [Chondrus crispus]|eukprot:YP_007627449.1 conserved hypothetical plastid protein (plastid) [Chondrus crispus]